MKLPFYFTLSFISIFLLGCPANKTTGKTGNIDSLSDDQINKAITKKLANISFGQDLSTAGVQGYKLPPDYINAAPYLVGKLVDLDNTPNGASISLIGDFNYLLSPDKVSNSIVNNLPFFDTYINKFVAANLSSIAQIKAGMSDSDSYHVSYQTVLSSVANGPFINLQKLISDSKMYELNQYKNLQIIYSVMVNRLSYTKYTKISGNFSGANSIISLNGSIYGQSGSQINSYELYVTTVKAPLISASKIDTQALSRLIPSGIGGIEEIMAVRKESILPRTVKVF
jgi:hypothetical protein